MKTDSQDLLTRWGIQVDPELLVRALTHRSFSNENEGAPNNERLEFLGDAVLGIIVTEWLYRKYPSAPEGKLSSMRAATVSEEALAQVAEQICLGEYLLLGRGEEKTGGRKKASILSDALEALIAATFLCNGMEATRAVVEQNLAELLAAAKTRGAGMDWKTSLVELMNQLELGIPEINTTGSGPDHDRTFHTEILIGNKIWGSATGKSKKKSEYHAAGQAVEALRAAYQLEEAEENWE